MKNKTRILLIILTFLIIIPTFASCSSCKKEYDTDFTIVNRTFSDKGILEYGYFKYRIYEDGTAIILLYTGSETNLTIPDSLDGHTVVEIYDQAFSPSSEERAQNTGAARLTSVTLNPSLEKLGSYAFYDCINLSSVTFGDKLWRIGADAFGGTPFLKSQTDDFVIVGNGILLKYQGKDTSVTIPDSVKHISTAFYDNCELKSVFMGDSVLSIGVAAFSGCLYLSGVHFGNNLKLIDAYAFNNCNELITGKLPASVEEIGEGAFFGCMNLRSVALGSSLKKIGRDAFYSCSAIRIIEVPATLTEIAENAFYGCEMLSMIFYEGTEGQFKAITFSGDSGSNYRFKDAIKIYGDNSNEK